MRVWGWTRINARPEDGLWVTGTIWNPTARRFRRASRLNRRTDRTDKLRFMSVIPDSHVTLNFTVEIFFRNMKLMVQYFFPEIFTNLSGASWYFVSIIDKSRYFLRKRRFIHTSVYGKWNIPNGIVYIHTPDVWINVRLLFFCFRLKPNFHVPRTDKLSSI